MNWNVLRYAVAIAEERSFSKAARRLYLAQPSLSQSIAALERELGTPLFDRSESPLRLTHAGELFVEWARDALREQEQTVRRIADLTEGAETRLTVGASPSRSAYLLPPVMSRFRQLRPNCSVIVYERTTNELWAPFEQGKLDLLLEIPFADVPFSSSIFLGTEQSMLAVPQNLPCPIQSQEGEFPVVNLADFSQHPFVTLSEGQMLRRLCTSLCARYGFRPKIVLECRSVQTAHAMVEAGVGVAIMPEFFVRHAVLGSGTRYCLLEGESAQRKIAVTYRNDRYLSRDAQALIELLQEMLR